MKKHSFIKRLLWAFVIFLVSGIILMNSGCGDYYGCSEYEYTVDTPSGPSTGCVGDPVEFYTSPVKDFWGTYEFDWGDGYESDGHSRNGMIVATHTYDYIGEYGVSVVLYDDYCGDLAYSGVAPIDIIIDSSISAPETPSIPYGDTFGYTYVSYTFSSHTIDPQSEDIAIRFDWGDGDTSSFSDFEHSGQTIRTSHTYNQSGIYYIKAQAKDINNILTEWSDTHMIKIISKIPPRRDRIRRLGY